MGFERPRAPLSHVSWRLYASLAAGLTAVLLPLLAAGCRQSTTNDASVAEQSGRSVTVVNPSPKTVRREVGQPGVIQAFERTPIVAKIPGYILKWNVDIGDPIRKDQVLAELWVPEMLSELKLKEAMVQQAQKTLAMAQAQVVTAVAQIQEATDAVGQAQADYSYWKGQNEQFTKLV